MQPCGKIVAVYVDVLQVERLGVCACSLHDGVAQRREHITEAHSHLFGHQFAATLVQNGLGESFRQRLAGDGRASGLPGVGSRGRVRAHPVERQHQAFLLVGRLDRDGTRHAHHLGVLAESAQVADRGVREVWVRLVLRLDRAELLDLAPGHAGKRRVVRHPE